MSYSAYILHFCSLFFSYKFILHIKNKKTSDVMIDLTLTDDFMLKDLWIYTKQFFTHHPSLYF